jgi:short-subunit dehydrogenase
VRVSLVNPGFVRTPLTDKNPFAMPALMEVDDAARALVRGLARGGFEVTFPRRFTYVLKLLRLLPYRLYFPLMARITRK